MVVRNSFGSVTNCSTLHALQNTNITSHFSDEISGTDKVQRQVKSSWEILAVSLQFEFEFGAKPMDGEHGLKSEAGYESPLSVLTSKTELRVNSRAHVEMSGE
jgi:hypothetical protein